MKKPKLTDGEWFVDEENSFIGIAISAGEYDSVCDVFTNDNDAKAISALHNLIDALIETDKDLCVLEITMRQIEKKDHLAEGMTDLVIKWRERNKQALKKAGCTE